MLAFSIYEIVEISMIQAKLNDEQNIERESHSNKFIATEKQNQFERIDN